MTPRRTALICSNESQRFRTEGDHIVFTHVPESLPEDEAHARKMKNRTSETRRRDVTAHFTWSPDRTGPQNLESRRHESRNDHRNALIMQDGYSYWIPSYPTTTKMRQKQHHSCGDSCLQSTSQEESAQTSQGSS